MSPQTDPSRVGTPRSAHPMTAQMGGMNFMGGASMPQGFNQSAFAQPVMTGPSMQPGMQVPTVELSNNLRQRQAEAQQAYQFRMQAQQQQLAANNMAMQQRTQAGFNPMMAGAPQQQQPAQGPTGGPNSQQHQQQLMMMSAFKNPAQFMQQAANLLQQRGKQFNQKPVICGRPQNIMNIWMQVSKAGGSQRVSQTPNGWAMIANSLGYPPQQFPSAGQEMKFAFDENLALAEAYFIKMSRMRSSQQAQMPSASGPQMSPTKPTSATMQDLQAQQQQYLQQLQQRSQQHQAQQESQTPQQHEASHPVPNGLSTPQQNSFAQHRKSISRQMDATPPAVQTPGYTAPSPAIAEKQESAPTNTDSEAVNGEANSFEKRAENSTHYKPKVRALMDTHGGIQIEAQGRVGEELARLKPNVPNLEEMGVIDIRSLCMSIQSGISGEVRYALDILVKLSHETRLQLELDKCEDLVDVLVDCAEEQLDALAEEAQEVSDILDLTPYEDVVRSCQIEIESLQDIPEYGTVAYDLDRAADRLIAITTIFRNLSFFELNHSELTSPSVIKLLSYLIRLIGSRERILRSHVNLADIMKDVITFLSNTADKIELPSRDEAYNILQFLLAFAPCPAPSSPPIRFAPYSPGLDRYLPCAIDGLAKLLARDEPNRAYYKQLFNADATSNPPYDLLTRAFGLAISVIPERAKGGRMSNTQEYRIVELRRPYLTQGMLAADILSTLAPGPESGLARMWLNSEDGWAPSLLRLSVLLLSADNKQPHVPPNQQAAHANRMRGQLEHDQQGYGLITHRAFSLLKRLAEKSKADGPPPTTVNDGTNGDANGEAHTEDLNDALNANVFPKKEVLFAALVTFNVDALGLKQLSAFANLDE